MVGIDHDEENYNSIVTRSPREDFSTLSTSASSTNDITSSPIPIDGAHIIGEATKAKPHKAEALIAESHKVEALIAEAQKVEELIAEAQKVEAQKVEAQKVEEQKAEAPISEYASQSPTHTTDSSSSSSKVKNVVEHIVSKEHTIFIFDWDDTLCPSSWLNQRGFTLETTTGLQQTSTNFCTPSTNLFADEHTSSSSSSSSSLSCMTQETSHREIFPFTSGEENHAGFANSSTMVAAQQQQQQGPPINLDEQTREILNQISERCIETLQKASELGTVIIVTNAEEGWIDVSCEKFLPRLSQALQGYKILSARSTYENAEGNCPFKWKIRAFKDEIIRKFGIGGSSPVSESSLTSASGSGSALVSSSVSASSISTQHEHSGGGESTQHHQQQPKETPPPTIVRNILSFGDGAHERHALRIVAQQPQNQYHNGQRHNQSSLDKDNFVNNNTPTVCFAKSVKLVERPSAYDLIHQHELIIQKLPWLASYNGDLDLCVKPRPNQ